MKSLLLTQVRYKIENNLLNTYFLEISIERNSMIYTYNTGQDQFELVEDEDTIKVSVSDMISELTTLSGKTVGRCALKQWRLDGLLSEIKSNSFRRTLGDSKNSLKVTELVNDILIEHHLIPKIVFQE